MPANHTPEILADTNFSKLQLVNPEEAVTRLIRLTKNPEATLIRYQTLKLLRAIGFNQNSGTMVDHEAVIQAIGETGIFRALKNGTVTVPQVVFIVNDPELLKRAYEAICEEPLWMDQPDIAWSANDMDMEDTTPDLCEAGNPLEVAEEPWLAIDLQTAPSPSAVAVPTASTPLRPPGRGFMARRKTGTGGPVAATGRLAPAEGKAASAGIGAAPVSVRPQAKFEILSGTPTSAATLRLTISGPVAKKGIFVEITAIRDDERVKISEGRYALPEPSGDVHILDIPIEAELPDIEVLCILFDLP